MLRDTIPGSSQRFKQDPNTGILFFYDQSRAMYVSTDRETYTFGIDHKKIKRPRWMLLTGRGNALTNGYPVPRDGIITCLTITTKNIAANTIFRIRSTVSGSDITSIQLSGTSFNKIDNLKVNINQNDHIRVLADVVTGQIDYPVFALEIAWR